MTYHPMHNAQQLSILAYFVISYLTLAQITQSTYMSISFIFLSSTYPTGKIPASSQPSSLVILSTSPPIPVPPLKLMMESQSSW